MIFSNYDYEGHASAWVEALKSDRFATMQELQKRFATIQETANAWADLIDDDLSVAKEMVDAYHVREHSDRPFQYSRTEISGLIPAFRSQNAYRTLFNKALTRFQDTLLAHALNARLQETAATKRVVIMAGGTSSGKTTVLSSIISSYSGDEPHAIWDTTAKNFREVSSVLETALSYDKLVDIYFVYRPYQQAARGAVSRALGSTPSLDHGKTTSSRLLANAHYHAPHTVDLLFDVYKKDHRVQFAFVDNSLNIGEHRISPLTKAKLAPLLRRDELQMVDEVNTIIEKDVRSNAAHPRQALIEAALDLATECSDRILI